MQLRQITVERFRGIKSLTWVVDGTTVCLVGPGDATKSTILDAIEWALWPRPTLTVGDADFFGVQCDEAVVIEVTVGELPQRLLSDDRFGLEMRGWSPDGQLHDEPEDGDELVLTIRMSVDDSLEPVWEVVNDRQSEPRGIYWRDRERLGVTRLGPDVERHLTWARGSSLSRLTADTDDIGRTLASAARSARQTVDTATLQDLEEVAARASDAARQLGAGGGPFHAALDPGSATAGASALGLHSDRVPSRMSGSGSRRLAALAVQRLSVPEGAIILVDEVETGLEPHRLCHLLRMLGGTPTGDSGDSGDSEEANRGQAFLTTHSPVAVTELECTDLRVVRAESGMTTVASVPVRLQALVRAEPRALLCKRVLVCEGKTELGVVRRLARDWTTVHNGTPPEHLGVSTAFGNGQEAAARSLELAGLGYDIALLTDSDQPLDPDESILLERGVEVIAWAGGTSIEERIALDVPWGMLSKLLDLAASLGTRGRQSVNDVLANQLGDPRPQRLLPDELLDQGFEHEDVRKAVGTAAKKGEWFKRTDWGEALGDLVAESLPQSSQSALVEGLARTEAWIYAT